MKPLHRVITIISPKSPSALSPLDRIFGFASGSSSVSISPKSPSALRPLDRIFGFASGSSSLMAPGAAAVLAFMVSACDPTVVVGTRVCLKAPGDAGPKANATDPITLPWSTGFEDGFCDYAQPNGFCFGTGTGSYSLVTSPVHSGRYAAAFSVQSEADAGSQVRCVRQGIFPPAAYYGAWYYVPTLAQNSGLWNLLHFQAGIPGHPLHGLWDVSLVSEGDAGLHMVFFDFLTRTTPDAGAVPPIPIGQWFHIEVYFKRAKDGTGELSMWQDGVLATDLRGIPTDDTNWGQWYVGNLASALLPPASTVYVDDVSIGASR